MEISAFIVPVIVVFIVDVLCIKYNMSNLGAVVAVAIMGQLFYGLLDINKQKKECVAYPLHILLRLKMVKLHYLEMKK